MDNYILQPSDFINIGSCVVAIVSAIIAVVSCAIGKKQYKLFLVFDFLMQRTYPEIS